MPTLRVLLTAILALAGARAVRADSCPFRLTGTNCVVDTDTTVFPVTPVIDIGDLNLKIKNGVTLSIGASVTGPGDLTIKAGSFFMEPSAAVSVKGDATGRGGHLAVIVTRGITLDVLGTHAAVIDATGTCASASCMPASSTGGRIELTAGGDISIKGPIKVPGVPGSGGEIDITAGGNTTIQGTNLIQAAGGSQGLGGNVSIIGTGPVLLDSSIDASGTVSGGSLDLESNGDFTTTVNAPLLVGSIDTGGCVLFDVRGSVTINAKIDQGGRAGVDFGGTGGELDMFVDGDITFNAPLDQSGTPPDGAGGLLDIEAGRSIIQNANAPIAAGAGNGTDSGGGTIDFSAEKDILANAMDASGGGFGGGSIDIESKGVTTIAGELNADGDDAGDITLVGLTVNVQANAHADALAPDGTGGSVAISACTVGIPAGVNVTMSGSASGALLQASGLLTIGGTLSSAGGPNAIQYRDVVPVIQSGAVIQPPTTPVHNGALPSCDNFFPPPTTTTTTIPGATTTTSSTIPGATTTTTSTVPTPTTTVPPGTTTTSSTTTSFTTTSHTSTIPSTSSSTTLVVTTTSTSNTSSSVTSSSVVSGTSSTTSTRPECSAGDTCDDNDACTVDACNAGHCDHERKTGTDAATCVFEQLDADLTDAGASNLGGPARATALLAKVSKARSLAEASRSLTGRKHLKKLKAANKQVTAFTNLVTKGEKQHKIAAPLADRLLGLASTGAAQLQQLMTP